MCMHAEPHHLLLRKYVVLITCIYNLFEQIATENIHQSVYMHINFILIIERHFPLFCLAKRELNKSLYKLQHSDYNEHNKSDHTCCCIC